MRKAGFWIIGAVVFFSLTAATAAAPSKACATGMCFCSCNTTGNAYCVDYTAPEGTCDCRFRWVAEQ